MQAAEEDTRGRRAISRRRDKIQSRLLVGTVTPLLAWGMAAAYLPRIVGSPGISLTVVIFPLLFSFGFAAAAWAAGTATLPAAAIGLLVCLILAGVRGGGAVPGPVFALVVLVVLTFGATRFGRASKERRGLAEARGGRRASQIAANLGVAALCASVGWTLGCIAALAEAAADTVSSEVGQAIGGQTWLITTFRRVPGGRDGGMSLAGTGAGVIAAGLVACAGGVHHTFWPVFVAGCAGLVFDSVLGATVEQWGWIGNDLVNFGGTLFAAALAGVWMMAR